MYDTRAGSLSLSQWALVPLRLLVGYGFMAHGYAKLARGPAAFAAVLHALGVPAPDLMAWATIVVELLGGLAIFAGAFIGAASVALAAVMIVAILSVHLPFGFSSIKLIAITADGPQFGKPGYETALLYLAALAAVSFSGRDSLALDSYISAWRKRRAFRTGLDRAGISALTLSRRWTSSNNA